MEQIFITYIAEEKKKKVATCLLTVAKFLLM